MPTQDELFRVYPKGTHPFSLEQLRHLVSSRKELTVAVLDDEVVGFANLYDVAFGKSAYIGNVVVAENARGQGFGRTLVQYMLKCALDKYEVKEVKISVFSDNIEALLLYASIGFVPYEVEGRMAPSGVRTALLHMKHVPGE